MSKFNPDAIHITGWHSMTHTKGGTLSSWEYYWECAPLDAPEWLCAGSTQRNPCYGYTTSQGKTLQRSFMREH